jgi:hypothetical protein
MSLITRYLPPDAKGFKLTFSEMDNNLYYLQSLGVSGLTYSANTLTITNPTGGTKSVKIVENNNRWYIPSGETITIDSFYQSFIYGDVVVEGTLDIKENAQLVVLNGDLISSGGTIVQSGDTYLIDLPLVDTSIDSFTYSDNTFTIIDSTGGTFSTVLNVVTGLTVNGNLTVTGTSKSNIFSGTTISADTIYPKVIDLCENNGTLYTDTISGCSPINILSETYFQVGISATTISGGTLYGDGSNLTNINNYITTAITLTSLDILSLGTPFELLPTPGVNNYYIVDRVVMEYSYGTSAYTFSVSQAFYLDGCFDSYIDKTILTSSANTVCVISGNLRNTYQVGVGSGSTLVKTNKDVLNSNLLIGTQNGDNPTSGDGTLKIKITYKIETFGS